MTLKNNRLSNIPVFQGLKESELEVIAGYANEEALAKGSNVISEGDLANSLIVILSGLIKIYKTSPEGREQTLEILKPGDVVNAVSAFDGLPSTASAVTLTPTIIINIPRSNLELAFKNNPQLALNIAKVLSGRVRTLASLVEDLSFKNVTNRIAKILLQNAQEPGSGKTFTHQEMAAMAGTAREVVSRSLKTLEGRGIIRLDRHRVVITNREALKQIAAVS